MRFGKKWMIVGAALSCLTGVALAAEPASDYEAQRASEYKAEIEKALTGAVFTGTYARDNSPYVLQFGEDGTLTDNRNSEGRWWVSDQGEYCREWSTGPLAGTSACLEVLVHGKRMAVYSGNDKVLDGQLARSMGAVMRNMR
jgi:hypothetical protein